MNDSKIFIRIGMLALIVSAILSFQGLFTDGLYQDTNQLILVGWWINDWVTLIVAVPLFIISIYLSKKSQLCGYALLFGLMMYSVYNYSFYLFGAAFNAAFLGYVIMFILGLFGLIVGGITLYSKLGPEHLPPIRVTRCISIYMLLLAVFLMIGWVGQWLDFVLTGTLPVLMEQFDATNHLVAALDMTLVVPWFLLGAILLWKQQTTGLIFAFLVHTKTVIYNIILLWGSIVQMQKGIEGAAALIPVWSFFLVGSILTLGFLFIPLKKAKSNKNSHIV